MLLRSARGIRSASRHRHCIRVECRGRNRKSAARSTCSRASTIHQPVGRGVMLVEADAVITEPVHFLPRRQMLGIGLRRDRGLEVLFLERERQLVGDFQVVEMLAIRQEVENEDFHCAKFLPASKKQKTLNHKDAKAPSSFSPRPTSPMIVLASWRLGVLASWRLGGS